MSNRGKFAALLADYIAGNSTPADYSELMRYIKSGSYDDLLKQNIENALLNADNSNDLDKDKARRLLLNILNSEKQTAKLIAAKSSIQKPWLWVAAAAVIIIIFTTVTFQPVKNAGNELVAKKKTESLQSVPDLKGKKYIRLSDGSTVLLNKASQLIYPDRFGSSVREVTLIGEGYFDIKHETNRLFIVHTGKIKTTVLGTAFNIKAYPNQKLISVTVTRGKVKVSDENKTIGVITPNECIAVNTENNLFNQEKVNADDAVAWKKQYLVLDNISMEDAAILIGGQYHVNISFSNEKLKACRISATFLDNENLDQVLTVITAVVDAHYSTQPNDQIIVTGEGCY